MFKGFDCAATVTAAVAARAVAAEMSFVARYHGTGHKLMTPAEVKVICAAGLRIVSVFERTANRALSGGAAGSADGAMALVQANAVGQPKGTVIFFAVDVDTQPTAAVRSYFANIATALAGQYQVGVYGNGAVCKAMLDAGYATRSWVWAGSKTAGTADFTDSGVWDARQYPTIDGGALGISYDPDDAPDVDAIAWSISAQPVVTAKPSETPADAITDAMIIETVRLLQTQCAARKRYTGTVDGILGPQTAAAAMAAYNATRG